MLSASAPSHFPPPGLPEVAFLGRSNVGKSSVINSLVGAKIAKTSNTPGRTQAINFFEIRWPGKPEAELIFGPSRIRLREDFARSLQPVGGLY